MNFLEEVWGGSRPYLLKIAINLVVAVSLWVALYVFDLLTRLIRTSTEAGAIILALHSAGVVMAFFVVVWYSVIDIYEVHRGQQDDSDGQTK